MAAIKAILQRGGSIAEVEKHMGPPSHVYDGGHESPSDVGPPRFWSPGPNQQVLWFAGECLPCYFDLWLLIDKGSRKILDSRLFRLDRQPAS